MLAHGLGFGKLMCSIYTQVLGISSTATKAEVKKAYKALSLKYHPDKPEGDAEIFKVINDAYQKLVATPATSRTYGSSRYR